MNYLQFADSITRTSELSPQLSYDRHKTQHYKDDRDRTENISALVTSDRDFRLVDRISGKDESAIAWYA